MDFPLTLNIFKVIPVSSGRIEKNHPTDLEGKRIPIGSGTQPIGKL
ncbi:MAG TPA: hypothetical protein VGK06_02215 [Methanosarcina sp.]